MSAIKKVKNVRIFLSRDQTMSDDDDDDLYEGKTKSIFILSFHSPYWNQVTLNTIVNKDKHYIHDAS